MNTTQKRIYNLCGRYVLMRYLVSVLKSRYCILVFILSMILSYFLIPQKVFYGIYIILALLFMISFSLTLTCIVRNVKEKIMVARTYETSIVGVIAAAIGLASLQVCGIGAPICGATIGMGILSSIFPAFFVNILSDYAHYFIGISIILQLVSLYFMNCFKSCKC